MALKAENKSGPANKDFPKAGTHMARLVGLTDLGHQPGFQFKGQDIPSAWKVEFTYELPKSLTADGRPHWVSEEVKVNSFEGKGIISTMMARVRTLDPDNESEDGKNLQALLGKPCMVTVTIGETGYPKMKGQACVSGIPVGMDIPELANDSFAFDMDDPDMSLWDSFPEFKKNKITGALNYEETALYRELASQDY